MTEQKKYVCPNCGSTTTNAENCEHCGSLLVRFVAQGIDISNTTYTDDSIVFPGLIEELEKNLRFQAENKEDVFTEIHWINKNGKEQYLWVNNQSEDDNSSKTIQLDFEVDFSQPTDPNSPDYEIEKETELIKFSQLKSFPLFSSDVDKDDYLLYRYSDINCGRDAKGTARILSEILIQVFGISPSDSFGVFTGYDDNSEDYFAWRKKHGYNYGYWSRDDDNEYQYPVDLSNETNQDTSNKESGNDQTNVTEKYANLHKENDLSNKEKELEYDKFYTSFKDLVVKVLANSSEIKRQAERGDDTSCFQMGMIHLLGINTPIDFKKASHYFGNKSLSDSPNANLLLGFMAECDGDYSSAFHYYVNTESSEKDSYLDKVIKGRNHIQDYLRKLDLPITVNKEISSILNDYSKSKTSKIGACIKIAAICEDEQTCLEAAKNLFDAKDYISAIQWLKKGNIAADNAMYMAINDMFEKSMTDLLKSKVIQIVDLDSNSLLSNEDPTPFLNKVKKSCDDASRNCSNEWKDKAKSYVGTIIKNYKDKEHQDYLDALAEEEARKRKRNKTIKYGVIATVVLFVIILAAIGSSSDEKDNSDKAVNKEVVVSDNSDANSNEVSRSEVREEDKRKEESSSTYQESDNSGYDNVLSERRLSDDDLADKTKKELEIMRNSIYARYGYKFKREDLLNHFSQYSWYNPTTSDMGAIYNMMNDNEKFNVDFIKKHE